MSYVHCRSCKERINKLKQDDWVNPSNRVYYHKICYENFLKQKDDVTAMGEEGVWHEALLYYLSHVVKVKIDYKKLNSQWKNYLKQNKTAKGIYFAIKYYYEVQRGDKDKSLGGIGIVASIYDESKEYWYGKEEGDKGLCQRIEEQIKQQLEAEKVILKQTTKKSLRNKAFSLEDVDKWESENASR